MPIITKIFLIWPIFVRVIATEPNLENFQLYDRSKFSGISKIFQVSKLNSKSEKIGEKALAVFNKQRQKIIITIKNKNK